MVVAVAMPPPKVSPAPAMSEGVRTAAPVRLRAPVAAGTSLTVTWKLTTAPAATLAKVQRRKLAPLVSAGQVPAVPLTVVDDATNVMPVTKGTVRATLLIARAPGFETLAVRMYWVVAPTCGGFVPPLTRALAAKTGSTGAIAPALPPEGA